jgi:hypothetical protein
MSKDNTTVGEKLFMWRIKGDHHSVFGHIPVQKEKYYIIRNLEIDCNTYIQRALLALGRKIDIFKLIYTFKFISKNTHCSKLYCVLQLFEEY